MLACVASVSVEQRAKKRGFRRFARAKNGARAKIRRRGWGRGRKETLAAKHCDQILRSPANGARDWLGYSNMRQSKVLKFGVPERTFEACICLQKALTFLTERVFSRELRQYGRNPVVQCRRFGISKPDYYCRCNCDTIFAV